MKNTMHIELAPHQYLPEVLFERLCAQLGVKSYSELGVAVGLSPSVISKVRHRKVAISSEILLKIHEATDIPVRELRRWMGDTRPYYSPLSRSVISHDRKPSAVRARHDTRAERIGSRAMPSGLHAAEMHG